MSAYETLIGEAMINPGKADLMMARYEIKLMIQYSRSFCCPDCGTGLDQKKSTVINICDKEDKQVQSFLLCSPCANKQVDGFSDKFWQAVSDASYQLHRLTWTDGKEAISKPEPPTDPRQIDLL